jgi:FAD/FMN-containing dehydrogenase
MTDGVEKGRRLCRAVVEHGVTAVHSGDDACKSELRVFNGAVRSAACAVTIPHSDDGVASVVREAAGHGLSVSMRAGGHGVSGRAVAGDVVIDLRLFRSLSRSGPSRVRVGAGVTWAELDAFTASFGKVIPGGIVSSTGVAGLTLGGGLGWLLPIYGVTCDSLVSLRGVTGEGAVVELDDARTPALMPIARGYGNGLLAVTSLEFEVHALPLPIEGGTVTFAIDDAASVLAELLRSDCPLQVNFSPALMWRRGEPVLAIDGASFAGPSFAHWVLGNTSRRPIAVATGHMTYPVLQRMLDNPARWGQRCSWRSWFGRSLTVGQLETLVHGICKSPSEWSMILIERLVGAITTPPRPASFPLRDAEVDVLILANWWGADADRPNTAWAEQLKDRVVALAESSSDVTYANYGDASERTIPSELAETINRARRTLDPDGLFAPSYRAL